MTGSFAIAVALWSAASGASGTYLTPAPGNALTLPAQRHVVRMDLGGGRPATWLLALQKGGLNGQYLVFWRSDDEGATWRFYAPIASGSADAGHRADLVAVGDDVALVWSYEDPTVSGSASRDVWFQWWRYAPSSHDWVPDPAVRVFDSTSSATAYHRAELAVDSLGRIWVHAVKLESDGTFSLSMAVSTNGGTSFLLQGDLDRLFARAGGRLLALGGRLLLLYDRHDAGTPARFRLRDDAWPLGQWQAATDAFPDGIYHGAALSAVEDGAGGMHLVYKSELEDLYYRHFDGTRFGVRVPLVSPGDWAAQSAITLRGDDLFIFYNDPVQLDVNYHAYVQVLRGGVFGPPVLLDDVHEFKGYPAAAARLPASVARVPCVFSTAPDASSSGQLKQVAYRLDSLPQPDAGAPPDAGFVRPDAALPDAASADAGVPPDAGLPDAGGGTGTLLFSDSFTRSVTSGLGAGWQVLAGAWRVASNTAQPTTTAISAARLTGPSCADCEAAVTAQGAAVAILLRASADGLQRYQLVLQPDRQILIQRVIGSSTVTLGQAPSGLSGTTVPSRLGLSARGAGPVSLVATVGGVVRLSVTDSSSSALRSSGLAGIGASGSGIWFDDFQLWALAAPPPPPGPDAGVPDAALVPPDAARPPDAALVPPDAATPPDASVPPDAAFARPDAATVPPDAATVPPDAAFVPPDAATPTPPDAGSGNLLFSDSFTRTVSTGLGAGWQTIAGSWRVASNAAQSTGSTLNAARVASPTCAECQALVDVTSNGAMVGVFLRASPSGLDRYQLVLLANGQLQIQRVVGGGVTSLGSAASGLTRFDAPARLGLSASGAGPVSLVATVDGIPRLSAVDTSASALRSVGAAGIGTDTANVVFDNFELWSAGGVEPADAGVPADAGSQPGVDAGTPSGTLAGVTVLYTNSSYELMAVDAFGSSYGVPFSAPGSVYASSDGRSWGYRGSAPNGGVFRVMAALSDGTLLAETTRGGGAYLSRSTDRGAHWVEVLTLGDYRMLTPHSVAELNGEAFLLEYQSFTTASTPIHFWASRDSGATWSQRFVFQGHRHGHGLAADPVRSALWAYFGDTTAQCGTYRSLDGGRSWTLMLAGQEGDIVDATVLADGSLLFGQDISYLPNLPHVARLTWAGTYSELVQLSGPSYSIHALSGGGFVAGAAREPGADIYPPGEVSAHLYLSADGVGWSDVLQYQRIDANQNARMDVYWELPTGELVLRLENVDGISGGRGYQLLRPERR